MRFHIVSLPHTEATGQYIACAYTQKVAKFCRMMHGRGHEVFLYAGEQNSAPCTEHVTVVTRQQQRQWFGEHNPAKLPTLAFRGGLPAWVSMNTAASIAIRQRAKPRDFVCLIGGNCQKPIADALPDLMSVEYGIGYEGVFSPYRCFESHAWRHYIYGRLGETNGANFDTVIPNYFDPAEFHISPNKDDYCLFIGRLVARKGAQIAVEATRRAGVRLLLAGQGVTYQDNGRIVADEITLEGDHIEHVGPVDAERRSRLMACARAVFVPTVYLEPFGGVAVEAQLCGTPVITSDYGAFPETVVHGVTGFRCNTLADYVEAIGKVDQLDPAAIRRHAMQYSLDAIAPQYEAWFERLSTLWGDGWYAERRAP